MTLAQQIEADLRQRLRAGAIEPDALKLEALARHYGTSTRPIRQALQRLREGGLPKRARGKPPAESPAAVSIGQQTAVEELMVRMSRELAPRAVQGDDAFLREAAMAETYGVSTTLVREAFNRLAGRGIVEHVARRGWRVRVLTQKDFDDFNVAREAMELLALRLAWDRLDRAVFRKFLEGNRLSADGTSAEAIDNDFHAEIVRVADNRYVTDFIERHGTYFALLFDWESLHKGTGVQTVTQHRRILRAIVAGNQSAAEKALSEHIRDNHPVIAALVGSMR